jgi:putative SbcD/Mre11-related phosphoesterase
MIHFDWQLTPQRVAIHLPTATAVAADLHLGYQEARQRSGDAIPIVDVATQLAPLTRALTDGNVQSLVIAGDMFERSFDAEIWRVFRICVSRSGVRFLGLIPGNHDRGCDKAPSDLPILSDGLAVGRWQILHGDGLLPTTPVVIGHHHPCVLRRGRKIPCYLANEHCLVLPAFSNEAAGAIPDKRWQEFQRLVIGEK